MKSNTRKKIAISVTTIVLSIVLLISASFALFVVADNEYVRVTAGDMEMDLLIYNESGLFESIADGEGDVFGGIPWEPGYTQVVFLKVKNNSNIDVKYKFRMITLMGEMDGALEYCAFESDPFDTAGMFWQDLTARAQSSLIVDGPDNLISGDAFVYMAPGEERTYALAVHMLESSGNRYQNKHCIVDVNVYAVQANADESKLDQ